MKKLLFVCTGNTCRSPMAEFLFRQKAEGAEIAVSSAGLYAGDEPISENAKAVLWELGIDASGHRSRQLTPEMAEEADLVLTMTEGHRQAIIGALPALAEKVETIASYAGAGGEIPDPFGGDLTRYRLCRDTLAELVGKIWEKVR